MQLGMSGIVLNLKLFFHCGEEGVGTCRNVLNEVKAGTPTSQPKSIFPVAKEKTPFVSIRSDFVLLKVFRDQLPLVKHYPMGYRFSVPHRAEVCFPVLRRDGRLPVMDRLRLMI